MHFKQSFIKKIYRYSPRAERNAYLFFYQKSHQQFLRVSEEQIMCTGGCHDAYGPGQTGQSPYGEVSLEKG